MTTGGNRAGKPRWGRLVGIVIGMVLIFGGIAACQAIRAADPEYQCKQGNGVWVDGYGQTPHCTPLTPKQPRH